MSGLNIPLLLRLRAAEGRHVPRADLPGDAADLDALVAFGFEVDDHPLLGVAYRGPARRLCPDQIEWGIDPAEVQVGRRIAVWGTVASTNDLAALAASTPSNHGLVVLAEAQTAGRGRRGRAWSAPESSSILMSILIFPPPPLADPAWLTALGAVAVADLIVDLTGLPARIKWPNDVRIGGRKVAGVLVERRVGTILGIGLNVLARPLDLPEDVRSIATSLEIERPGGGFDRSEIARSLIERIDSLYKIGLSFGPDPLFQAWAAVLEEPPGSGSSPPCDLP